MLLWTLMYRFLCEGKFKFLLCVYLEVELLGHVVTLCLNIWETANFSKVAVPYYISTSNVVGWWAQSLYVLTTCDCICLITAVLVGMTPYLTVVLIFICWVANDIVHLFYVLNGNLHIFFGKLCIQIPYQFFNCLLLNCNSSLYSLDLQTFSSILWVVFSLTGWYPLKHKFVFFILMMSSLLLLLVLLILLLNHGLRSQRCTPMFFLRVL